MKLLFSVGQSSLCDWARHRVNIITAVTSIAVGARMRINQRILLPSSGRVRAGTVRSKLGGVVRAARDGSQTVSNSPE